MSTNPVPAVRAGGDGDDAARPQDRRAAGEDLGEPVGEFVGVAVGELAGAAVPVVELADLAAPWAGGADLAVGGRPVRRGRDHERDPAVQLRGDEGGKLPGVTLHHLAGTGGALAGGEVDVAGGQPRPTRLVLHSDAVPAQVHCLHDGGGDSGHRVAHGLADVGVGGD